MKVCTKCHGEFSIKKFPWKAKGKRGSWCVECELQKDRDRRRKNIKAWMEVFKEFYKELKCQVCEFDIWEALEFHHLIPRKGDESLCVSNIIGRCSPTSKKGQALIKSLKDIALLCANCHRLLHAKKICL